MFKRLLRIVCFALLLTPMSFFNLGAQSVDYASGLSFQVQDDGTAMITAPESGKYAGNKVIPETVEDSYGSYTVTAIGTAFQNCPELLGVSIPATVVKISAEAFKGSSSLTKLELKGGVEFIGNNAFEGTNIQILSLGEQVTKINNLCLSPSMITSTALVPPVCDENTFWDYEATVSVPAEAREAYINADYWEYFFTVRDVTLNFDNVEINEDNTISLEAIVESNNMTAEDVVWTSTDSNVATVDKGFVNAVAPGECDIIAECNGQSDVCHIVVRPILPEQVILNEHKCGLRVGETVMLEATVLPANVTDKTVVWTTTNPDVATVDNGLVSAIGVGSCFVIASCQGVSDTCEINVEPILPTSVELNVHESVLTLGESMTLVATVLPENVTDKTVVWTTSDASIATVDNGVVTSVGVGECDIIATCQGVSDICHVIVNPILPTSLELNEIEIELIIGDSMTLVATVMPENVTDKTVVWTTTDADIATVDNGVVTSVGLGECDVIASCHGVSDTCHVIVKPVPVYVVTIDQHEATIHLKETIDLEPVVEPACENLLVSSSDNSIATGNVVGDKVVIKALGLGTALIEIGTNIGQSVPDTCVVKVITDVGDVDSNGEVGISDVTTIIDYILDNSSSSVIVDYTDTNKDGQVGIPDVTILIDGLLVGGLVYPDSLILSQHELQLAKNEKLQLTAKLYPTNVTNNRIEWISTNSAVAKVQSGLVTAMAGGECDIIARCMSWSDTCHVSVTEVFPESVTLSQESATMLLGEKITLTARVNPDNVSDPALSWSSTDKTIATVNDGEVTAVGIGECDIIARCQDKQATCHVVVTAVYPESVTLSQESADLQPGEKITLIAEVNPENVTDPTIVWSSTKNAVATVANGVVTAVAVGECDIIAQCQDKQATCHIVVSVKEVYPESVTLNQTNAEMQPGERITLKATVNPSNVTNPTVTWSTTSRSVATVTNGVVTAVGAGECDIIATCQDKQATCHIVVTNPAPQSITLSQQAVTLQKGGQVTLQATVLPASASSLPVTWKSSNTSIATVSKGVVTAVNEGECDIVASCQDLSATCHVTVVAAGDQNTITVNGVTFRMVNVEGGTFMMGASITAPGAYTFEKPEHKVTLSNYKIGQTQVTQELWKAVMGSNPSRFSDDLQNPVEQVSWNDCQTFITKLNELTGMNFRLPTEAEWEYAARGGQKSGGTMFSGSATITDVAWCVLNASSKTHPVASLAPNELGIYDMTGNVNEWCNDWYGRYDSSAQTNPTGPASGSAKVYRGGSWEDGARLCRNTYRYSREVTYKVSSVGFRLAL